MSVLKDYHCENHGIFEAWEPKCPMKHCNGELSVVFLKPVGTKSAKTKHTDGTLKQLAIDYGMTDIKSTREGEHQTGYLKRNNKLSDKEFDQATDAMNAQKKEARPGDAAIWGGGGSISMKSVLGGQFKPVKDEAVSIMPRDASPTGTLSGPKAGVGTMRDPDNLQVKTT
jgi:hypothetical protein